MAGLTFPWLPGWSIGAPLGAGGPIMVRALTQGEITPAVIFPAYSDAGEVAGGAWRAVAPAPGVQTNELDDVARSTDLAPASCTIRGTLRAAYDIGAVYILGDWTPSGEVQITLADTFAGLDDITPAYRTPWLGLWPTGLAPEMVEEFSVPFLHIIMESAHELLNIRARYWKIVINDPANLRGNIDIRRVIVGGLTLVPYGMAVGMVDGLEDDSDARAVDGVGKIFTQRPVARTRMFDTIALGEMQAYDFAYGMQRSLGRVGQAVTIFDVTDARMWERAWLARLRSVTGVVWDDATRPKSRLEFEEVL